LGPLLAGATAVLLLVTGVLIVYSGEESYRREKIDEVEVEARILASTVIAALTFDDRNAAQTYVGALDVNPEIEAAAVYDANGQPFAIYRRAEALSVPAPAPDLGSSYGDDRITVTTPVTQGVSLPLGRVYVRAVLEPLSRRYERYGVIALLVVMAGLVTAVLAIAQSTLSRSNRELSQANRRAGSADRRARKGGGGLAPGAKDGGDRPDDRPRRARFQQHPAGCPRQP
jgi:hypothetical protein